MMIDLKMRRVFLNAVCVFILVFIISSMAGSEERLFFAQPDSTVMDSSAGLIWAPDGGTPAVETCAGGKKIWQAALDYIECLNSNNYLGYSDWRLPIAAELSGLGKVILEENMTIAGWLNRQGFVNVQASYYWSYSVGADDIALAVDMLWNGYTHPLNMASNCYVWPVRDR